MRFFEKAKALFGIDKPVNTGSDAPSAAAKTRRNKDSRPKLPEVTPASNATVDDVLALREAGAKADALSMLSSIDKGHGLRTVLHAAAVLEVGNEETLAKLLPQVVAEHSWQLTLQVAAALSSGEQRESLVQQAASEGAPGWALAWVGLLDEDEAKRREKLVDLLFEDAALARTVAARELALPAVRPDNDAIRRYTAFAHGRDVIRRFGPEFVRGVLARVPASTA